MTRQGRPAEWPVFQGSLVPCQALLISKNPSAKPVPELRRLECECPCSLASLSLSLRGQVEGLRFALFSLANHIM